MTEFAQQQFRAVQSSAAMHVIMAVAGLVMALFLLLHMFGNLKVFSGQTEFDAYAAYLRSMGTPILPHGGALWILRVVLLVSIALHLYAAAVLWRRASLATGGLGASRYHSAKNRRGVQRSYASFTMRWGGIVIGLFIVYHLLHLTVNWIAPGGASASPYQRLVNGFSIWWVTAWYLIALVALGLHLQHGIWSALAALGTNTSPHRRRRLHQLALLSVILIIGGFLAPPVSILAGWI